MSFTENIKKTDELITILEYDVGRSSNYNFTGNITTSTVPWVNCGGGIYCWDTLGEYAERDDSEDSFDRATVNFVGSVIVDGNQMSEASSYNNLADSTYFWDNTNKILYVYFPDAISPIYYNITVGITIFIADSEFIDGDNNIHFPLLNSVSNPKYSITPNGGTIIFNNITATMINDGSFDEFSETDIYRQKARVKIVSVLDLDDKQEIFTGYVSDFTISQTNFSLKIIDPRKDLDNEIIQNYFNTTDYPNLSEDDEGKAIPVRYGRLRKVNPICTNRGIYDSTLSQTLNFKLCDTTYHTIQSIDYLYSGDDILTMSNIDLNNATFDYAKSANEEIDFDKLKSTFNGYIDGTLIESPEDIIADLLLNINNTTFTSDNYDLTRWNLDDLHTVFLDIEKSTKIVNGLQGMLAQNLTFTTDRQGRYYLTKEDLKLTPSTRYINQEEILNLSSLSEQYKESEIFATIKLNYDNGRAYINDSKKAEVIQEYKVNNTFNLNTSVTTNIDLLSDEFVDKLSSFRPLYSIQLPIYFYDTELNEIVLSELNSDWKGINSLIIESSDISITNKTVTLTGRFVDKWGYLETNNNGNLLTNNKNAILIREVV